MGVCDSSSMYYQNKLITKENKNELIGSIHPIQSLNQKKCLKTQLNSSKSNQKEKNNNFYSITEINNYKMPTNKCSPKLNNVSYSFEKNQLKSKKTNSRNISLLKEDIQTKKN